MFDFERIYAVEIASMHEAYDMYAGIDESNVTFAVVDQPPKPDRLAEFSLHGDRDGNIGIYHDPCTRTIGWLDWGEPLSECLAIAQAHECKS